VGVWGVFTLIFSDSSAEVCSAMDLCNRSKHVLKTGAMFERYLDLRG